MYERIRPIIKHAYKTTPLYTSLAEERDVDIEKVSESKMEALPVVEKNYMMQKEDNCLSWEYVVKAYREDLINVRTSGSTGKYLNIYWDKADFTRSLLPLWIYRKKYYNINADDKMCYFYTARSIGDIEQRTFLYKNQLGFAKTNLDIDEFARIYEDMKAFQPKWLNIQPSMAALLCQSIRKYQLSGLDSIEYVEFTGELLSESVRREVENIFNCKTANQYGSNETNSIAYECPYGNLHIMQSNVYVEILNESNKIVADGEEGSICVTSLTNKAMPFVRYKIGDRGFKKKGIKCSCGNCSDILDITAGRKNDYAIDENGDKVNSYVFVRAIDNINAMFEGVIKQFQIEQLEINQFSVKLVVDEDVSERQIEELFYENFLQSSLRNAEFEFEFYDELLADDATGKLRYFVNKMSVN